jgi:glutamate---methylamine ligase
MTLDLEAYAAERGVKYFMISFTDLFGGQRAKLVPAQAIKEMQSDGAAFAGFATWLDLTPAHPDMLAVPDPTSVIQLPWKPEVAWVASTCIMDGAEVAQAPRNVLRRQIAAAADMGLHVKTGVEAEFFLLTPQGTEISDEFDTATKPCYDQQAVMRRYDVVREICDYMLDLGWEAYQNDHEDANGQFEMNWKYDDVLATADKHSFFKFMTKSVAEKHGFRATFMPKPIEGLTGNGCHVHISVWDGAGQAARTNVFATTKGTGPTGELGLSDQGRAFLGGIMAHGTGMVAITNPTVNSYKRINAPRTISGASWAPNTITWTGNNRTHMVRVPGPGRFELRLPDGAANPYLLQAVILAAGLDGIRTNADPGPRHDIDMYAEGHTVKGAPVLPLNLLDALRAFDGDTGLKAALGEEFASAFLKLKMVGGITLFLFGGVAELQGEPQSPGSEFRIAIAGPLMSLALAALFGVAGEVARATGASAGLLALVDYLAGINLILALFNLLPAFPLDGGRVLRAALWHAWGDLLSATRAASLAGRAFGYALVAFGLAVLFSTQSILGGLWPILLGLFLAAAAAASWEQMFTRRALLGRTVGDLMTRAVHTTPPDRTVRDLVDEVMLRHGASFVPVIENGQPLGYVDTGTVRGIDREFWDTTRVEDVFVALAPEMLATPADPLEDLLGRISATGRRKFIVLDGPRFAGVVTLGDLAEHLGLLRDLAAGTRPPAPPRSV